MTNQRSLWNAALVLCSALLMASPAKADTYSFDFVASSGSFLPYSVVGTFTTDGLSTLTNGYGSPTLGYDITSITGSVIGPDGGTINGMTGGSGVMVTNYAIGFIYDNVAFPTSAPGLDVGGMLFTAGPNNSVWNLWATGTGPKNSELYSWTAAGGSVGGSNSVEELGNLTVSPIPEPAIFAQILAGLGLFGFVARRRMKEAIGI